MGAEIITLYNRHHNSVLVVEQGPPWGGGAPGGGGAAEGKKEGHVCFMPLTGANQDPGATALFVVHRAGVRRGGDQLRNTGEILLLRHMASGLYIRWNEEGEGMGATPLSLEAGGNNPCYVEIQVPPIWVSFSCICMCSAMVGVPHRPLLPSHM